LAVKKSRFQIGAEYALAFTLVQLMEKLPLVLANQVAAGTARLLDRTLPKLRRVAETNLSFALPDLSAHERRILIDGTFRSLGRLLLALARAPRINAGNVGDWISYQGLEHYQSAKQAGKGALIATAHLGNWELSAYTHALMTEPMSVMVRPLDNPLIDALVERRRALSGNHLIYKKDAARHVLKALKSNQAVGILIDQNASPSEGVFVDFFGRKACANAAFVKFAYHSSAKVIPGFAFWDDAERRYILRFYPEIPMTGDACADTQRIHSFLERVIRQYPDQWMWIHRRWKTRPEDEPPIY
jgi:KDO2-lipid IV(A) lauroyltransferase